MLINLYEVPSEGQSWVITQQSGELNSVLSDLIGSTAYRAELHLTPLSSGTFDIKGFIRTEIPEDCSRCGLEFKMDINERFHDLLMPVLDTPRDGQYTKANHYSDQQNDGPSVVDYEGHHFNAGEYFHEVVGLTISASPAPEEDEKGNCRVCKIPVRNQSFGYDEPMVTKESPFAALKKIKV